LAEKLAIKAK